MRLAVHQEPILDLCLFCQSIWLKVSNSRCWNEIREVAREENGKRDSEIAFFFIFHSGLAFSALLWQDIRP